MHSILNSQKLNPASVQFLDQLQTLAVDISSRNNNLVKPWNPEAIERYKLKEAKKQERILKDSLVYADVFTAVGAETNPVENIERRLLEVCANKLGIVFDPNVYNTVTNDHIIEVYNEDLIQIYRNLSFFNLCSYNLLDLLSHEYYELYERSVQVNTQLFEVIKVLNSRPYNLEPISLTHIAPHVMREKFSDEQKSFIIQFQTMHPVYTWSRKFYGYLVLQTAEVAATTSAETSNLHFL